VGPLQISADLLQKFAGLLPNLAGLLQKFAGPITVQVGWVYKFMLKNVEMHLIVIGLETYTSAPKYVLFLHMYGHIHPNLHLDTAFWGLR